MLGHESLGRVLEAPAGGAGGRRATWWWASCGGPTRCPAPTAPSASGTSAATASTPSAASRSTTATSPSATASPPSSWSRSTRPSGMLGVLLEPTSVVAKAWEQVDRIGGRAHWEPKTAVVTGAGPIGLLAALIGRAAGPRGPRHRPDDRRASSPTWCAALGAAVPHRRRSRTPAPDPDVIIECTGVSSLVLDAMEHVGPGGVVCLTGVSSGGRTIEVDEGALNRTMVLANESVVGSVNANRRHYEAAAERPGQGRPRLARAGWSAAGCPSTDWAAGARPPARRREGGGRGDPVARDRPRRRDSRAGRRRHRPGRHRDRHPARRLAAGHGRVPDRGPGPGAGRDGQPVLGARCCWRRSTGSGSGPTTWPGWSSPTSTSTTPAGWATWPGPSPQATVYVHEKGARHLADPTRLVGSAARVYGPLLDSLYGRLDPTPGRAAPRAGRRRGDPGRAGPGAGGRRLARPRQAPRGPARLGQRDPLRRRRRRACGCPTPACCGRPRRRPTSTSTRRCTRCGRFAERRPTGIALAHYGLLAEPERPAGGGRGDPAAVGRDGRARLPARAGTSPTPWPRRFDPPTGATWRPSTARSSRS